MSRFKNIKVESDGREYTIKGVLGEGGFSFVYNTDHPEVICKLQIISLPEINQSYQREK